MEGSASDCMSLCRDRLRAAPAEHPLMLAEPTFNTRELREKTVELAFEKLSPPAVFMARSAVLTSFAMGRQSSLVVDAGHEGTTGEKANISAHTIERLFAAVCPETCKN